MNENGRKKKGIEEKRGSRKQKKKKKGMKKKEGGKKKKKKKKEEKIWKELFSNKKKKIHIYDEDSQKDDLKRSLNSDNKLFGTLLWGNDIKKKKRKKFSRVDPSLFIDDIRHWCNDLFSFIGNYYFTSLKILSHVSLYLYLSFFTPSFLQQVFFLFFFFTLL